MANIPVGWPPVDIAAANMQVSVSIRGDRRLISLHATLCGTSPCPSRIQSTFYGGFEPPCMKRVIGIVHQL